MWHDGARHGHGHYIYPDLSEYEGEWFENWKHGKGVYKSYEGDEYRGSWSYGKRQGPGRMALRNGVVLDG